jgi:hypothetical protein
VFLPHRNVFIFVAGYWNNEPWQALLKSSPYLTGCMTFGKEQIFQPSPDFRMVVGSEKIANSMVFTRPQNLIEAQNIVRNYIDVFRQA